MFLFLEKGHWVRCPERKRHEIRDTTTNIDEPPNSAKRPRLTRGKLQSFWGKKEMTANNTGNTSTTSVSEPINTPSNVANFSDATSTEEEITSEDK